MFFIDSTNEEFGCPSVLNPYLKRKTMKNVLVISVLVLLFFVTSAKSQVRVDLASAAIGASDSEISQSSNIQLVPEGNSLWVVVNSPLLSTSLHQPVDRKQISVAIPIHVPKKKQLLISSQIEQASSILVDEDSQAVLSSELFIAGSQSIPLKKIVKTPGQSKIVLSSQKIIRSSCGQSVLLRLSKSISSREASITAGKTALKLQLVSCKKSKK
jgi:hypothetical protein